MSVVWRRPEPPLLLELTDHGSLIQWQDVPRGQSGGELIGDIPETILPLVIARLREIQTTPPDTYTAFAIDLLDYAQLQLETRRAGRDRRGVTGTDAR